MYFVWSFLLAKDTDDCTGKLTEASIESCWFARKRNDTYSCPAENGGTSRRTGQTRHERHFEKIGAVVCGPSAFMAFSSFTPLLDINNVHRSDLLYSIRTQTLPRFPFQHLAPNTSVPECLSPTHLPRRFTTSQALLSLSTAQSINIFAILEALNDLATLLNAYPNGVGQELPTSIQYPDRVYVTEHEIVSILYTKSEMPVVNEEATSSRIIVEIFLHACLLYIYTNLRQTPVGGAMRRTLSARLKSCIQRAIDLDALLDEFSTEMLWVCMMGLATAGDNEFWILVMNRISSRKTRQTWSDIEKELLNMPVLEKVFEESCYKVWKRSFRGSRFDSEEATQNLDMLAYA